jgi:ubiquitin carboxyl-terminal hydrolase 16/45
MRNRMLNPRIRINNIVSERLCGELVNTLNCPCATEQSDADVEDNVEQDVGSKGHGMDLGESGYSSEKVGNEDSAVESPLPRLANGDSALASPASPADMDGATCADVTQICKELVVTIPASPLESVGSPLSPSPVSSELNIDCSSSVSTRAHGDCLSPDCNRPVSRFAFCHDDDLDSAEGMAKFSPVEDDSCGAKSPLVSDLCENISRLCTSSDLAPEQNVNGCEEKQRVCGDEQEGGTGTGDMAVELRSAGQNVNGCEEKQRVCGDEQEGGTGTGDVAVKLRSAGETANWSETVLPRYQCDDGECSVQSCLNQFTALELMAGNNKVGCENCTRRHNQGEFRSGNVCSWFALPRMKREDKSLKVTGSASVHFQTSCQSVQAGKTRWCAPTPPSSCW